jgi:hypothetical protein
VDRVSTWTWKEQRHVVRSIVTTALEDLLLVVVAGLPGFYYMYRAKVMKSLLASFLSRFNNVGVTMMR